MDISLVTKGQSSLSLNGAKLKMFFFVLNENLQMLDFPPRCIWMLRHECYQGNNVKDRTDEKITNFHLQQRKAHTSFPGTLSSPERTASKLFAALMPL